MASYPYPVESDVFNDRDYIGNNDSHQSNNDGEALNSALYIHKSGDAMTGPFSAPEIQVGTLSFYDNSSQQHAFTDGNKASIESLETKTQHITLNTDNITSIPDIIIDTLHFGNTSNVQTQPFTDERNAALNSSTYKLSGTSYYAGLGMTQINNAYIQSLTCDNINTSHLGSTTSSVQTQITDIGSKIASIGYDPDTATTSIEGNLSTSVLNCDAAFITNLSCGNVNMLHLSGLASNVQQQLNNTKTQANTSTSKLTATSYDPDTTTTTIEGNLSTSLLDCDAAFITNLSCENVNMLHLSGLTSNVQQQLNNAKTQADTSTSKLTATSYNSSTKTTSITADGGQTAEAQLALNNGSNGVRFTLNCTPGAFNAIVQPGDNLLYTNAAPLVMSSWSSTPTGIRITQTNVEITGAQMMSSFQMVGSTAVARQINGVGYLDFADTANLSSSNVTQMYQSGTNMVYHNTGSGGGHSFFAPDSSGNLFRSLYMDASGLTFKDGSLQTTAFTNTIRDSIPIDKNPAGTILPYAGKMIDIVQSYSPPAGYLWCDGSPVSQTTYATLFAVVGQNFRNGKTLITGSFYLPDLRSAFLKGTWSSPFFPDSTAMLDTGEVQRGNVGWHAHTYVDRGEGSKAVTDATGSNNTTIANDSSQSFWTDGASYDQITHSQLDQENRPNCVGVNYIIKY